MTITLLACSEGCDDSHYVTNPTATATASCDDCGHVIHREDVRRYLDSREFLTVDDSGRWGYLPPPTNPNNVWMADPHTGRALLTARRACYGCGSVESYRDHDGDVILVHNPWCEVDR